MTDIKQVSDWALTIAAEAAGSKLHHYERMADDNRLAQSIEAHARAIEQHEAFRQEVSETAEQAVAFLGPQSEKQPRGRLAIALARFILPKPDPLAEAEKLISTLRADEREGYAAAGQAAKTISNLVAALRAHQKDTNA